MHTAELDRAQTSPIHRVIISDSQASVIICVDALIQDPGILYAEGREIRGSVRREVGVSTPGLGGRVSTLFLWWGGRITVSGSLRGGADLEMRVWPPRMCLFGRTDGGALLVRCNGGKVFRGGMIDRLQKRDCVWR